MMIAREQRFFLARFQTYVTQRVRVDPLLWSAIIGIGVLLAGLSILHYNAYSSDMFDLGNMAQAIASVRRGEPLVFTYSSGQMSRLSLHVEWIYFLLAMPYAFWPDPRLLLLIQALLFAAGALPVYRLAMRRTDSLFVARCLVLIYLFYPVAQAAVLRDIHGDTLAMPLLLFAIDALDRRAWRAYWLWLALALSCKVYVALPAILLGVLIWWDYRERRVALATTSLGIVYGVLTFLVVRPLFTTTTTSDAHRGLNYISFYFGELQVILSTLDWRFANALVVFGPVMLLAWRGWRWLAPGLPIALAALLSTVRGSAGYGSHHYALVVPFLVMATLVGVEQIRRSAQQNQQNEERDLAMHRSVMRRRERNWRGDLGLTLAIVVLCNLALIDTPLSPTFWMGLPGKGLDQMRFGVTGRDRMKDTFLAEQVPAAAPLAASLFLAPHLTDRDVLYLVRYEVDQGDRNLPAILPRVDYVLADALFDFRQFLPGGGFEGGITAERPEIAQVMHDPHFALVAMRDGLLLFQRDAAPDQVLEQQVSVGSGDVVQARVQFGASIGLLDTQIEPLGSRRYRATFVWQVTGQVTPADDYVAVSQIEGMEHARMVHLPTYILHPASQWQRGQILRESFDVAIPQDVAPGQYSWRVGWYSANHSEAFATDVRSRIVGSDEVVVGTILVP